MRILKKFLKLTNDADGVNGQGIPANFTPSTYTPTQVGSEGTDKISAHLKGIDVQFSGLSSVTGDIAHTTFSAANNQSSPANVTGLAFANGTVRSFDVHLSVAVDATTDLFEKFHLQGIQKGSEWDMSVTSVGDSSGFIFSITNAGQIQYTNSNYAGFTSANLRFRATVTQV